MAQLDFIHTAQEDADLARPADTNALLGISVSIFADRAYIRDTMREDATAAGFRLQEAGPVSALMKGRARPIGEVVLLDCPIVDAQTCAALSRLDMRAVNAGVCLVVSTSVPALDEVFACLDQSRPQILVEPSRGERVIALGRVLARVPNLRLCELSEEDRLTLLRLTEQVGQIAEWLEKLAEPPRAKNSFWLGSPDREFRGSDDGSRDLGHKADPSLPDPRIVRQIIRQRQLRSDFFEGGLFADPAWDMLLDLTAARGEKTRVSVSSLCIASGVPPTTALRWITQLINTGLADRVEDETDRRRAFIALSDTAADAMAGYFERLGNDAAVVL